MEAYEKDRPHRGNDADGQSEGWDFVSVSNKDYAYWCRAEDTNAELLAKISFNSRKIQEHQDELTLCIMEYLRRITPGK